MTIVPAVRNADRRLVVKGRTILTGVPESVISTPARDSEKVDGVFIGANFQASESRHVTSLGNLRDVRFLACFRFKLWWMAQKMGDLGRDIPPETQFLLVENTVIGSEPESGSKSNRVIYTVFLPLIEGPFRACLQGNAEDELELCLKSGDEETKASSFTHAVFVAAGTDPFATITEAITSVKLHLKTFKQRHEKKLPGIINYFGWCTWDAFYQDVTQEGVEAGLATLTSGGTPPKFAIIDDGWQSVDVDQETSTSSPVVARLTGIKENQKFRKRDDPSVGIRNIVSIAKEKFGVKYVYVWHAITGYWGGVRPGIEEYESLMKYPMVPKGVMENDPLWKTDGLVMKGLGLIDPKSVYRFYNDLHSYLASNGIDGVKVDVQCVLETLGGGLGGRVELTRRYHEALDLSVARNFPDNGCISCMSHGTDALYCSKQTAIVRASDDFYPSDPVSHTIHIAAVAYNSVFLGEIMQPDWDMFQSLHPAAEYHGSARGISGGPVYVSDTPGKHNFDILKKLVFPDGSVLRARLPGRPTKDCLFNDPARDGISLLKIWNMNKYTGVLGVYNCQGAAWSRIQHKNAFHKTNIEPISEFIRGDDVHLITEACTNPDDWNGDCVAYSHRIGKLLSLPYNATLPISLKVLEYEIFIITPIRKLASGLEFAPLGIINMFNGGGAIEDLKYETVDGAKVVVRVYMEVKGCGKFGAYSSTKPRRCMLSESEVDFSYELGSGLVVLQLDQMPDESKKVHAVEFEFEFVN